MRVTIEIDADQLKIIVLEHIQKVLDTDIRPGDIQIEVKSTQNYKAEWEQAAFRARVNKIV
jgi:hypothetical protein